MQPTIATTNANAHAFPRISRFYLLSGRSMTRTRNLPREAPTTAVAFCGYRPCLEIRAVATACAPDGDLMTRVRLDDVKKRVRRELLTEAALAAGPNRVLSQTEQGALQGFARVAAQAAREVAGPIVRAIEVADVGVALVDKLVAEVNQPAGTGWALLSNEEVERLVARDPEAGAPIRRAYDVLVNGPDLSGDDGATVKARIEPLLGDLEFTLLSSEGNDPIFAFHLPGVTFTTLDRAAFEAHVALVAPTTPLLGDNVRRPPLYDLVAHHDSARFPATAKLDAEELVANLRQLKGLTCFVAVPEDPELPGNLPVYIVGIAGDGTLAGIKTSIGRT
jgi:hypothetical protein